VALKNTTKTGKKFKIMPLTRL